MVYFFLLAEVTEQDFFFLHAGHCTELGKTETYKYIPAWQAEVQALFHSWLTNL